MGFFSFLYPWGIVLQAAAVVHFIRRRPETMWLWVIIFLGPPGALVYILMEMVPDLGLLRQTLDAVGRRKRIRQLEAVVLENPAAGNYEELGDLYLDEEQFTRARDCYDKAISARTTHADPLYRRGYAAIRLGDYAAAVADLERVAALDAKYDFHRAMALLAHAYANTGEPVKAEALFRQATEMSTSSEAYCYYASFLASLQRSSEAREWAQRVLAKKPTMPRYLQRRERPWFRTAEALLKRLPPAS